MRVRLILEYDVDQYATVSEAVTSEYMAWNKCAIEVSDILNMDEITHPLISVEAVEEKT